MEEQFDPRNGNSVGFSADIADPLRQQGLSGKDVWAGVQEYAQKYHPILLGIVEKVVYEPKTDRYIVHFGGSSAKTTNDTAEFLLRELNNSKRGQKPTVYAKMTAGAISSVFLLYM